jgi:hypothetical protein
MKLFFRLTLLSFLSLSVFSAVRAQTPEAADHRAAVAEGCAAAARLRGVAAEACALTGLERRHLTRDIVEYTFQLKVGAGEHDVIRLHRVVREARPGVPRRVPHSVFMVHGDLWGFDGAFLASALSANVPREQSIGVFLAGRGVDVWGVDLRWVQVPAGTADFGFMRGWNIGTHVGDLASALGVARAVRGATGSGSDALPLLGWSRGGVLAYAYANAETQLPQESRQVSALIPVDVAFKFNPEHEEQRAAACRRHAASKLQYDAGQNHSPLGVLAQTLGFLAATEPNLPSVVPGFAGLTNEQAALLLTTSTHLLFAPNPPVPAYHFNAGEFNLLGLPTGLRYTREAYLYDFLQAAAPVQSFAEQVETEAVWCGEVDTPHDDHLAEISVPVFYVGAEGGFGSFGVDTLSRLGSPDVSTHLVRLHPASARAVEFGHADLFLADNARELVWAPIHDWLVSH